MLTISAMVSACIAIPLPGEHPIEIVSIIKHIPDPPNPGGPTIEVNLKNISNRVINYVSFELGDKYGQSPFKVVFDVSGSNLFQPGETISAGRFTNGAEIEAGQNLPVFISGSFAGGSTFEFSQNTKVSNYTTSLASAAPVNSSQTYIPVISKEQAIAIASPYLPAKIILQSKVSVQFEFNQFSAQVWQVSFEGFSATQDELTAAGWEASHYTIFPDYPGSLYHFAYFNIAADTGKLLIKEVNVVPGGPGPETTAVFCGPSERPIEVLSLHVSSGPPLPAGPTMQISVKNIGAQAISSLSIELGIAVIRPDFFSFSFQITALSPLLPNQTANAERLMTTSSYVEGQYYPVFIHGYFQDGTDFDYTQYIQIPKYSTTLP